jgi:hypothetical protein
VYKSIREKVEREQPELANKMTTNLGFDIVLIIEKETKRIKSLFNMNCLELHWVLNFVKVQ